MDKFSFINGKNKKKSTPKKPAGNDQRSNAELGAFGTERLKSDGPAEGENVLISPLPESKRYDYGLSF